MKVLVLDGYNRAALAVTRSLGRAGHEVVVGDLQTPSLAHWSRYCSAAITYPDPVTDSDAFVDNLAAVTRDLRIQAVVPIADITTFLVTRHAGRLDRSCVVPFADADVIERAADKVDIVQTAQRIGVPVPKFLVLRGPEDVPASGLEFPLVIKPWRSRVRTADGWRSTGVSYAGSRDELRRDLLGRAAYEFPLMLQERIVGPGTGVFALYHDGRAVALFSHRRIRERPPWGGVSVLAESVEMCPVARAQATRLLDELGWRGVAMVEFKRDHRDNVPKLMEINGRFWGSLQLAIDAGVDFPALLLQGVATGAFNPQPPYRVGVRTRWFWGDVDSLMLTLFGGKRWPDAARRNPARALWDFGAIVGRRLYYDNPKPDDPWPWLLETWHWLRGGPPEVKENASRPAGPPAISVEPPPRGIAARVDSSMARTGLDEGTWNALASACETNTVFQTHQWARSWLAAFSDLCEPRLVTLHENGRVAGLAPLVSWKRGVGGSVLRFLGDGRADYCDIVAPGRKAEAMAAVFDALRGEHWSVIALNNIPAPSATPEIVRSAAQERGYFVQVNQQFACPTLIIRGCEAEARAILSKPSLRRRQNYFERAGKLAFRDLKGGEAVEPYLEVFFQQHIARWRETPTPSLFENGRNRTFYRLLTSAMSRTGWLLFSIVEFDDRPIAIHYGFEYNDRILWYKPSFDVAHAAHSPGTVMVRHLIQYAVDGGRSELDFTLGDEPFKKRFTNHVRHTMSVRVYRNRRQMELAAMKRRVSRAMRLRL